ncbi:hypothetical protein ACUXAV_006228 [Cupriavidus metallidurans]|jgi:hypothetical protein|uniref:hypothetical protein n=1 Tax=Cupriavidus TaxID=106589 RepID=UPI000493881A|nr:MULTISPECIES: hypothetical protein [Cupriavidus]PCH54108.1 MAG: hypothetical protein COC14_12130 [Burkholderiaceae bacterium]AVA35822.1 hypothetical protein C3Z06_20920 [Cupriavidus metallidurans]KWW35687.1 hypothetical protein AU374_03754 [Cupriavidus metallidurans]MCA3186835.1 hypothetical protein [Cupriavidus sp.]MCA3191220.1 hypothetical protein [Cupriavidus sp.]
MKRTTAALLALTVLNVGIGSAIAETARNTERGQIHRPRDPYTDGAKAADFDVYGGGAKIVHRVGEDIAK